MTAARDRARSLARPCRGQAIIETALVLPLLLTLVFGIAEMGLYMYDYVQAANCAREAARRAAVRDPDADAPPYDTPYCVSSDLNDSIAITPGVASRAAGTMVTASVSTEHDWLIIHQLIPLLGGSPLPDSWTIQATVVMRMEGQAL